MPSIHIMNKGNFHLKYFYITQYELKYNENVVRHSCKVVVKFDKFESKFS